MLALSIRQPYAELILRRVKTIEYRSRPTKLVGQRFYIYAARNPGPPEARASVNGHDNKGVREGEAPTGVIVGSAVIARCQKSVFCGKKSKPADPNLNLTSVL